MTHPLEQPRRDVFVLLAHRPLAAVAAHNRQRAGARDTADVAPYWYPVFVAGPFWFEETAVRFANDVMHHTRGLVSKCRRARTLAGGYGVPCYAADVPVLPGAAALYAAAAPPRYAPAFAAYARAASVFRSFVENG